jgi:hypothetical protein
VIRIWTRILSICALVLVSIAPTASARVVGGCNGSSAASALNQYCESFPTANGKPPSTSHGGTAPTPVAAVLSRTAARAIRSLPPRQRLALLSIPAPYRHTATAGPVSVDSWPLWRVVVLVIVGLALAFAAVALWRRRPRAAGAV